MIRNGVDGGNYIRGDLKSQAQELFEQANKMVEDLKHINEVNGYGPEH